VTQAVLVDNLSEISDHSMIKIKLRIDSKVKRTLHSKISTYRTFKDIRAFQRNLKNVKEILLNETSLENPLKQAIETLVPVKRKIHQFWQPMPEWFVNSSCTNIESNIDQQAQSWK
jgi:hypothetical protein